MRVAVVGGGVVGLCCAHELAERGAEVVVLERGRVGQGTSLGNTGWVTPSFTYPLPAPGVVGEGLRGLARGDGPLVIHPSLDPTFVRWLWRFWRSSDRRRWQAGVRALLALNDRTLELFDAYEQAGIEFEMHRSGLLLVAKEQGPLASYGEIFRELGELGFTGGLAELTADEARELEPALARHGIAGGIHARVDRYVRPESLTAGLDAHLRAQGVEIREGIAVTGMETGPGAGVRISTATGPIDVDRAVVAAGPSSPALLERLGIALPLVGARGYSVTFAGAGARPRHALYLGDAKVGISAYATEVRIAGVFELGRHEATVDHARLDRMVARCDPYFDTWRPSREPRTQEWAGLRPMTADGLPLIGRAPRLPGAFVATGHGMLGVTLAPATAALLAPLVLDGREDPALAPFRPTRAE